MNRGADEARFRDAPGLLEIGDWAKGMVIIAELSGIVDSQGFIWFMNDFMMKRYCILLGYRQVAI